MIRRRRRPPPPRALAAALAAALWACSGGEPLERTHDLAALLPAAEVVSEPRAIRFASPADRRHLRAGWSRLERDAARGGRGFAWGVGEASTVDFHLLAPRVFTLRLEGRPFKVPGAPPQVVTVSINDAALGELELAPELAAYALEVPRERLRAGGNRLRLTYRWSRSPQQVSGASDRRSLAVAWYAVGFGAGAAAAPDAASSPPAAEPGRLVVPAGSEVVYYLELEPGSRLKLDGWAWRGASPGRLAIELGAEHEEAAPIAELAGSGGEKAFALPGERKRLARLALRALPGGDAGGVVELAAPAVWAPAMPPGEGEPAVAPTPRERPAPERPAAGRPNVVLYLIDTLRADRLGCYGYPRPTSPRIDAFAQGAVLFERVVAQSSWTRSSMASVFTGRWPPAHGTNGRDDRLRGDLEILPDRLRAAGYRTAAFVTNPNVTSTFGFDRGFDDFAYLGKETGSDGVHRAVVEWLETATGEAPFFLWIHTLDPHAPYASPEPFHRRLAPAVDPATGRRSLAILNDLQAGRRPLDDALKDELEALYDASVATNDHFFGALLDELEARGLLDDALVVLLSDHGDEFHEHGNWQHGRALHAESIDVPLIVKPPASSAGRRVARPVRQLDVLPTVLDLLALPAADGIEGRSLRPLIDGRDADAPAEEPAFSFLHLDGPARVSVVDRGWKLIQRYRHGRLDRPRLYHLAEDPAETRELSARLLIRTGYLASLIRQKLAAPRIDAEAAEVDEATREALEALGYLGG